MDTTRADAFLNDDRITQARALLLETMAEHQRSITGVQPADPALQSSYSALLAELAEHRGAPLFFPYLGSGLGHGALVELGDGSVKYDFATGLGVHFLGHNHPDLVAAAFDAALKNTIQQGNLQQNVETVPFTRLLLSAAEQTGSDLRHCFLTSSGAMANENGLKLIFQKTHPAHRILAFENCFMGRTIALSSITDRAAYRQGLPEALAVDYVPYFDPGEPEASTARAVRIIKSHCARHPQQYAAMCFELALGEGGFYPGESAFFETLMQEVKEQGMAVLVDEIQTFGRTQELFAFRYFGLESYVDVVTIGKLTQVCATLYTPAFRPRPGLISQTFTGSTAALLTARVTLQYLLDGGYYGPDGKIMQMRAHCVGRLEALAAKHPQWIGGPYGFGGMIAFTIFGGDVERTRKFVHALFHAGVITFVTGHDPIRVRFLMPIGCVTTDDIDAATAILEQVLVELGDQ